MPINRDLKAMMEARKAPRRAIPQIDPGELVAGPPEREVAAPPPQPPTAAPTLDGAGTIAPTPPATRESTRGPGHESVRAEAPAAPGVRRIGLTPVDTSEKPINRGFHMYPSRHQQLLDLASPFWEDRKPWEIIESALAEYVERHYGEGRSIEQK